MSHIQLMEGLARMEVDFHIRRVIRNWLPTGSFQAKTRTFNGTCSSQIYPIAKGLPQGEPSRQFSGLLFLIWYHEGWSAEDATQTDMRRGTRPWS